VEHGGNRWRAGLLYGREPGTFLDFSANLNPLGPPPGLEDWLAARMQEAAYYPDPEYRRLKSVLKEHLSASGAVVVGNGAVELICLLPLLLRPNTVLVVEPGFGEYAAAARAAGARVRQLVLSPSCGFVLRPEELEAKLRGTEMCFIGWPNNPTGNFPLAPGDLEAVIARHPECLFVVDESFMDFVLPPGAASLAGAVHRLANLCVLYSLTKFFALPGLRLGCAVTSQALAERLEQGSPPWRVNVMAARAGEYVLEQRGYAEYTRSVIHGERTLLSQGLRELGYSPFPAEANFVLIHLGRGTQGQELEVELGRRGLLIRRCASFTGLDDRFIRVAVRLRWENARLLRALEEVGGRK
jgi:threonine-phosphate decarboxylase